MLKDGQSLNGSLVKKSPDEIIFSVEVTAGISEQRTFKMEDVAEVKMSNPLDKAFAPLQAYLPSPNQLKLSEYKTRIKRVEAFLNAFKDAKQSKEANAILKELKSEEKLVAAGGMKFEGQWLTKEQMSADAYELDAQILYADMGKLIEKGSIVGSLRKFEEIKQGYPGSKAFKQSVPKVLALLNQYEAIVKSDLSQVKPRMETRKKGLMTLTKNQEMEAQSDIDRRAESYAKRLAFEKKSKQKWLTLESYHARPMKQTLSTISKERSVLEKLNLEEIPDLGQVYRNAWVAAGKGNSEVAEELTSKLKKMKADKKYVMTINEHLEKNAPSDTEEKK